MANKEQIENFWQSWSQWRSSLGADQRWMADAMAWSATQGGEVQGYEATGWSWDRAAAWLGEQNASEWQRWSENWKAER